jgi:hypothetical protein
MAFRLTYQRDNNRTKITYRDSKCNEYFTRGNRLIIRDIFLDEKSYEINIEFLDGIKAINFCPIVINGQNHYLFVDSIRSNKINVFTTDFKLVKVVELSGMSLGDLVSCGMMLYLRINDSLQVCAFDTDFNLITMIKNPVADHQKNDEHPMYVDREYVVTCRYYDYKSTFNIYDATMTLLRSLTINKKCIGVVLRESSLTCDMCDNSTEFHKL